MRTRTVRSGHVKSANAYMRISIPFRVGSKSVRQVTISDGGELAFTGLVGDKELTEAIEGGKVVAYGDLDDEGYEIRTIQKEGYDLAMLWISADIFEEAYGAEGRRAGSIFYKKVWGLKNDSTQTKPFLVVHAQLSASVIRSSK